MTKGGVITAKEKKVLQKLRYAPEVKKVVIDSQSVINRKRAKRATPTERRAKYTVKRGVQIVRMIRGGRL